jgi:riboflavin kinase/FMN adenylyltransferase
MQIFSQYKPNLIPSGSSVALGVFDGVHLGHIEIIKNAVSNATKNNLDPVVATFINHPHTEITGQAPKLLTSFEERINLIEQLGIKAVLALEFDSNLNAKFISVGYDHKFGFNQEGNPEKLKEWGKKLGVVVTVISPVNINNEPVSSTRIRKNITAGQVKSAGILLGRNYSLTGKVTQGLKRGTELGFPTANLMLSSHNVIPAIGVYAGYTTILDEDKQKKLPCLINIGHCPTFKEDTSELKIEAHILNFPFTELYNKNTKIEFVDRIRDEQRFPSKEALIKQIKKDCEIGKKLLK